MADDPNNIPKSIRILIVDDSQPVRQLIKGLLNKAGYPHVYEADDGREAYLQLVQGKNTGDRIEFVLCDWNMPVMSGLEFLKAVRNSPDFKDLPFILITGDSEQDKVMQAIQAGTSSYLLKPVIEEDLLNRVTAAWKKAKGKK